jgi:hypothetical protein
MMSTQEHNLRVEQELKLQLGELHVRLAVALAEKAALQEDLATLRALFPQAPPPKASPP